MNDLGKSFAESRSNEVAQETRATLGLLHAIAGEPEENLTQRGLAMRLGVALGFTNALIKRCIRKGLIKVAEVPARRYAYYVTPRGFAEKSRLTAEYIGHSLGFFRRAREEYDVLFTTCLDRGYHRIVLYGGGDLAAIAVLAAQETGVAITCIVAPGFGRKTLCGVPVCENLNDLAIADAVALTDSQQSQTAYEDLAVNLPAERILVPALLNVTRRDMP